jgi:glucan 1,3-beta-glucosidase
MLICLTDVSWYQAEIADEWSYVKGLEGGWIPQDPTRRLYPDICG